MIDENATRVRFGYTSDKLTKGSGKKVVCYCEICGVERELQFFQYRDLCKTCAMKKHYEDPSERERMSKISKKRFENSLERERMSKIQQKRCEDPLVREKMSKTMKKYYEDPLSHEKTSKTVKQAYIDDPTILQRQSKTMKKLYEDPLEREKQSKAHLKNFQNPDFKERHHMWYNDADPDDGVVMLSPYSHRMGHAFLRACGVKIKHINIKEK